MNRCCGITYKGERCKIHTSSLQKSYGVDLPACRFHTSQNSIQLWSLKYPNDNIPQDIMNYLQMYWSLSEKMPFVKNIPMVMITSFTFSRDKKQNTEDFLKIRDDFYETQLVPHNCEEDCPICMERLSDVKTLVCNHNYCRECMYTWCDRKGTCPMCREQIFKIF